jgi:predicted kinase
MAIKRVVVLQGTSGSGKSTWARRQPDAIIVSADDNLIDPDGVYRFTPERQAEGHKLCLRKFTRALLNETSPSTIIVDNTNTRPLYMAPYVALGQSFQCQVEIRSFRAPVDVCVARNNGRAPPSVVREMAEAIEHFVLPPIWSDVDFRIVYSNFDTDNTGAR